MRWSWHADYPNIPRLTRCAISSSKVGCHCKICWQRRVGAVCMQLHRDLACAPAWRATVRLCVFITPSFRICSDGNCAQSKAPSTIHPIIFCHLSRAARSLPSTTCPTIFTRSFIRPHASITCVGLCRVACEGRTISSQMPSLFARNWWNTMAIQPSASRPSPWEPCVQAAHP